MAHIMPPLEHSQSDSDKNYQSAYPHQFVQQSVIGSITTPEYQPYQAVNGHDSLNHNANASSFVVQMGHNPSQSILSTRPWWLWAIAIIDIIIGLLFAARAGYTVVTHDIYIEDRDTLMWTFFFLFLSLAIQVLMGVGLVLALLSPDEACTVWFLQGWLCGAWFLLGETGIIVLGLYLKLKSGGEDVGYKVILVTGKICFRALSLILVRRFLIKMKKRSRAVEEERYRNHLLMQHFQTRRQEMAEHKHQLQLQQEAAEFQSQQQQLLQEQQQQQQVQEGTPTPPQSSTGTANPSADWIHYAPQMSYVMSMMMNK